MTDSDQRIEELERRVAQLETLVRQLATRSLAQPPSAPVIAAAGPVASVPSVPPVPPVPRPAPRPVPAARARPTTDWEQWFGRRALLAIGVIAMIATAGFFVKHAIDRGWISPWMRVNGGVLLGALIAIWGDRLVTRGLRLYGGAIIGAGSGLAYLAVWAASARYGLIGAQLGVLLLLGVTVSVAARAVRHRVEGLCAWAIVGAFSAPFLVPSPSTDLATLLVYLGIVALGCGAVAARLGWRRTFALAVTGSYIMPLLAPAGARADPAFAIYLIAGGAAWLLLTERRAWPESRLFALFVGWSLLLSVASTHAFADWRWLSLAGAFVLALIAWRHHVTSDPFVNDMAEPLVFLVSPWAAVAMGAAAGPPELVAAQGVVPALLAMPYLAAGWSRRSLHLVLMGFALLAMAIAGQWDGLVVALAWSAMAPLAVAADRWNGQPAGRPAAVGFATLGVWQLFTQGAAREVFNRDPVTAFRDEWSFAWYGCTALVAIAALWWPRAAPDPRWLRSGRAWLWTLAGFSVWMGGSYELGRAFASGLAADLALSAFWLLYAAALVAVGFRLGQRAVRIGGLVLAGLAAGKIVLYDLSQLDALYRVGSFFALAVIALAVAYAYNKRKEPTASEE